MNDPVIAKRMMILNEFWPEQCQELGESTVLRIATGTASLKNPSGGQLFDVTGAAEIIKNAAEFVSAVTALYALYTSHSRKKPSEVEPEVSAEARKTAPAGIPPETVDKIIKRCGEVESKGEMSSSQ